MFWMFYIYSGLFFAALFLNTLATNPLSRDHFDKMLDTISTNESYRKVITFFACLIVFLTWPKMMFEMLKNNF
jgi:hypothetical protein